MGVTPCGNIGNCTCGIHQRCQNPSKKSRLLYGKNGSFRFQSRLLFYRYGSGALSLYSCNCSGLHFRFVGFFAIPCDSQRACGLVVGRKDTFPFITSNHTCGSSRVTNCQINDGVSKYRQEGAFAIPMNNGNSCQSESLEFVQFGAESAVVDCAQAARSGNSVISVYPSEPQ